MSAPAIPDEATWAAFLTRLRSYVGRRVDAAQRDDLLGDILLRLVQNQSQPAGAERPLAWMYRVAGNAITDHHRRRAVERRALQAAGQDAAIDRTAAAESDLAGDLAQCLVPLIRQLPEIYAEALMLTEIEGLTQAEAARRLGISVSGVKSRVQRGRRQLKRNVLQCCAVELDRRGGIVAVAPRMTTATAPDCGGAGEKPGGRCGGRSCAG